MSGKKGPHLQDLHRCAFAEITMPVTIPLPAPPPPPEAADMQRSPLVVTTALEFAARWHADQQIVCKTVEGPITISTYAGGSPVTNTVHSLFPLRCSSQRGSVLAARWTSAVAHRHLVDACMLSHTQT